MDTPQPGFPLYRYKLWLGSVALAFLLVAPVITAALATGNGLLFQAIFFTGWAAIPLIFSRLRHQPAVVIGTIILWFSLQRLILAFLAPHVDGSTLAWLLAYKEAFYLCLPVVGAVALLPVFKRMRLSKILHEARRYVTAADIFAALFLLIVAAGFLLSPAGLSERLIYARRFASLPIVYLGGRFLLSDARQLLTSVRFLIAVAVVVAAFGLVERFVLGDEFWTDVVEIAVFQERMVEGDVQPERSSLIDGMPGNWSAHVLGVRVRRLVSTYAEPTTLASFLALAFVLALFGMQRSAAPHRRAQLAAIVLIGAALLCTLGKGGVLTVLVAGAIATLRPTRHMAMRMTAVLGALAVGFVVLGPQLPGGLDTSLSGHVNGLTSGIRQLQDHPLGQGLGTTGVWGSDHRIGGDSTMGVLASQLGIAGVVLWTGWFLAVVWCLLLAGSLRDATEELQVVNLSRSLAGAVLGLYLVSLLSESATGLLGNAFYVLLGGWTVTVLATGPASTTQPVPEGAYDAASRGRRSTANCD